MATGIERQCRHENDAAPFICAFPSLDPACLATDRAHSRPYRAPMPMTDESKTPTPASADAWWKKLGPGLITGAADDDPSGIATYSQGGAQYGYDVAWTVLITYPLMVGIQLASARIGRITGKGLTENFSRFCPRWLVLGLVSLLVVANVINLGADLNAMGDSAGMLLGGPKGLYAIALGLVSLVLAGVPALRPLRQGAEVAHPVAAGLRRRGLRGACRLGGGRAFNGDAEAALGKGLRDHHCRHPGYDHQSLPVLLGRPRRRSRRSSASAPTSRCASRRSRRSATCGDCAWIPPSAWASRTSSRSS